MSPLSLNAVAEYLIIATIGPASRSAAAALRQSGATAFRFNSSHYSLPALASEASALREALTDCPLVVDLQGAKMRFGEFSARQVQTGELLCFALTESQAALSIPHKEIFQAVAAGDTLSCDDDRLRFRVVSTDGETIRAVSLVDGLLRPRKGINIVEHPVALTDVTERDEAFIRATAHLNPIAFAFSFMTDGREADWIRRRAPGCRVIGKIERREGVENVRVMARTVDELWICRGDLGAQLGSAEMAHFVSDFNPLDVGCPVLMAGQVLEHLTQHTDPTRSEVCHLFDLIRRGYAGFILSDETAIGFDPVGAARTLRSLLSSFTGAPKGHPPH